MSVETACALIGGLFGSLAFLAGWLLGRESAR